MNSLAAEVAAKEAGIAAATEGNESVLELAREIAVEFAKRDPDRETSSAEVGIELKRRGYAIGNWMGALFRTDQWEFTGRFKQNYRDGTHAREVRVWRLKGGIA